MNGLREAWIAELWSPDEGTRMRGAGRIFTAGRSVADAIVQGWLMHEELASLLGGDPKVTVGLAVRPETFAKIRKANGWPRLAEGPAEQDASEFELHFAGGIALDVLTSREPDRPGAIAKFLLKFGEGVQQVEYRCSDVDRATTILRENLGVSPVYPETRPGADGTRVNFFLVGAPDGSKALVELYEPGRARDG